MIHQCFESHRDVPSARVSAPSLPSLSLSLSLSPVPSLSLQSVVPVERGVFGKHKKHRFNFLCPPSSLSLSSSSSLSLSLSLSSFLLSRPPPIDRFVFPPVF